MERARVRRERMSGMNRSAKGVSRRANMMIQEMRAIVVYCLLV